ncbi:HK97 family phage prohead protease [Pleionea sp. CnH1-48]|uniref:HK97 family phage prohead protease n=1 Tax=Pleionea sp. CnH1-48 TaxID=2954494 RepID=UPI0020985391|nr:HK97 family phage prohead protease [Pleionea sp. CnH1-48]MCO7225768.1 HK97 family phage prohead protease [Pleionea sp. CnH1-48]
MTKKETRSHNGEVRAHKDDSGQTTITGYAAVFNSLSENLGGFREQIESDAFNEVLENDVRALFNHDQNFVLGRSQSGTLKLSVDETGLHYEITPPDTQTVRDLVLEPMARGDISQSSFAFTVEDDDWREDDEGRIVRTIKKVRSLLDVSPVTYPAYTDTTSAKRSLDEAKESNIIQKNNTEQLKTEMEQRDRELYLLSL